MAKSAARKTNPSKTNVREEKKNENNNLNNKRKKSPNSGLKSGIHKIIKENAPRSRIRKNAIEILQSMNYDFLELLYLDAKHLTAIRNGKRITANDAQASVKLNLDRHICQYALYEASRSVAMYLGLIPRR